MPPLAGAPICVRFLADPHAHHGRIVSGGGRGEEVYAGSFLRKREIVLASELVRKPCELARIFVHELFHFVWLRAGNLLRGSYSDLLAFEISRRARGELGWSSEMRKQRITRFDVARRTRRWREYVCESFCDSAAWIYSGARRNAEFTLAERFRVRRREWFSRSLVKSEISI